MSNYRVVLEVAEYWEGEREVREVVEDVEANSLQEAQNEAANMYKEEGVTVDIVSVQSLD